MANNKYKIVEGKDIFGNKSYVAVKKESGHILLFSSEDCGDVVFTTSQAKDLVKKIEECMKE